MTAHFSHTAPSWTDRVTMARNNPAMGPLHIAAIRDAALALIGPGYASNGEYQAIADACQAYLSVVRDCVDMAAGYLDELDALLVDDEPAWRCVPDLFWRESHHAEAWGMSQ